MAPELKEMIKVANKNSFPVAKHMSFHWFRRFFATNFIERFPDKFPILIEMLGHSSPNTVHKYIKHSKTYIDREIVETLKGDKKWPSIGL